LKQNLPSSASLRAELGEVVHAVLVVWQYEKSGAKKIACCFACRTTRRGTILVPLTITIAKNFLAKTAGLIYTSSASTRNIVSVLWIALTTKDGASDSLCDLAPEARS